MCVNLVRPPRSHCGRLSTTSCSTNSKPLFVLEMREVVGAPGLEIVEADDVRALGRSGASHRCEPMKPAPPVTSAICLVLTLHSHAPFAGRRRPCARGGFFDVRAPVRARGARRCGRQGCARAPRRRSRAASSTDSSSSTTSSLAVGEEDLAAGLEQAVEPVPGVGDDRRRAGRGLEQPHAGRPAGGDHVGARDVQREARGGVECGVLGRRQMLDPLDVRRPVDAVGILRAGDARSCSCGSRRAGSSSSVSSVGCRSSL